MDFGRATDHGDGSDDPISVGNGITQNRPRDLRYSGPRCAETGREWRKVNALTFLHFFFFEINAGLITFADVFVYEQFGDMINILHEMCV